MTLLVITLTLPVIGATGAPAESLRTYLGMEYDRFISYGVTFFIIATWWGLHRRIFSVIVPYDRFLTGCNTAFLLLISISPFLVALLFTYTQFNAVLPLLNGAGLATLIFAAIQTVVAILLYAIWTHATTDHLLVRRDLPPEWIAHFTKLERERVIVYAVSMGVALVLPALAEVLWVASGLSRRHRRDRPAKSGQTAF